MTTSDAVKYFGSARKLAEALGLNRQSIYKWGDRPPLDRQCEIELRTGGELRADLSDAERSAARAA